MFTLTELLRCWAMARRNAVNPDLIDWRHVYERQMVSYYDMIWAVLR